MRAAFGDATLNQKLGRSGQGTAENIKSVIDQAPSGKKHAGHE
ncbi:hypothetical protein CSE45_3187 [Citreicella sp. SE45]|nr:hypothetical protein CSE45_3187 [Citreicella sp. SE45]